MGDRWQTQVQDGSSGQSPSHSGCKYKSKSFVVDLFTSHIDTWSVNLPVQVELKVMELLGGAEALPEDILRILK